MKIQRSSLEDGIGQLTLKGDFDSFSVNPFLEQIEAVTQSGGINVVVNLRFVLFINSTAIGALIKARKRLRGLGGDLVFSEISQRVKSTLDALGLSQVVKDFGSDDEAVRHFSTTTSEVDVPSENSVLLQFSDESRQKVYSDSGRIARMASLEEGGIHFIGSGPLSLYESGTPVKVKFRLPLFRRAYYFDIPCTLRTAKKEPDGVKAFAEFGNIYEEDRRSIAQFLRDMRLLKEELRGGS